jgi:predicted nucleic-acid-binding protein
VCLRASLIEPEVSYQSQAARAVLADQGTRCVLDSVVIDEFVYALEAHYGLPRSAVVELLSALVSSPNVECDRQAITQAAAHYLEHPKLSFADCYIAERARAAGAETLWTFDRKLVSQHELAQIPPSAKLV